MRSMIVFTIKRYPVLVEWLFYRYLYAFGLVFADRPGQGGGFAFQSAGELLASMGPGVGQTLSR